MPASAVSALNAPTGFAGEAVGKSEQKTTSATALLALGIVYGDLGTSPLYTLQTIVRIMGDKFTPEAAIGALSLIFWSLIVTISVKYCLFVMRADNHGEGGILALMTLTGARWSGRGRWLVIAGLFGAALVYGDGIITPAISVLSAVEGLNVATDIFKPYTMPIAVAILVCLFAIQSRGTGTVGKAFGPIMMVCNAWRAWCQRYRPPSAGIGSAQSGSCSTAFDHPWIHRVHGARRDLSGPHGRRGIVRGYGPHRSKPDPRRLV